MADIDLRLFRAFVALADQLHFARAAEQLHISAPTFTHRIQSLETRLGVRLCRRGQKRRVELTEVGKRLNEHARAVLQQAQEAERVVRQAARGEVGRIEIGYMFSVPLSGMLAKFIGPFQCENPGVDISIRRLSTMPQVRAIIHGELDVGFGRPPTNYPPELAGFTVFTQPMAVVLPANHRLARRRRIAPSDLRDEVFITTDLELDFSFGELTEAITRLAGFSPTKTKRAPDAFSVLAYVSAGIGVALLTVSMSKVKMPNVIYRSLAMPDAPQSPIACFYRRHETAPATLAFVAAMRRHELKASRVRAGD